MVDSARVVSSSYSIRVSCPSRLMDRYQSRNVNRIVSRVIFMAFEVYDTGWRCVWK